MDDDTSSDDVIIEDVMLLYYRGVNSTPDRVLESPSPFPIPVVDSDAFFEGNSESLRRSYRRRRSSGKYHNHAIYSFTEDYPDFEDSREVLSIYSSFISSASFRESHILILSFDP
ncbi:hypothetical protein Tco_0104172 [Tanacetum coccineum]